MWLCLYYNNNTYKKTTKRRTTRIMSRTTAMAAMGPMITAGLSGELIPGRRGRGEDESGEVYCTCNNLLST